MPGVSDKAAARGHVGTRTIRALASITLQRNLISTTSCGCLLAAISWHWLRLACSSWPAGFESTFLVIWGVTDNYKVWRGCMSLYFSPLQFWFSPVPIVLTNREINKNVFFLIFLKWHIDKRNRDAHVLLGFYRFVIQQKGGWRNVKAQQNCNSCSIRSFRFLFNHHLHTTMTKER